MSGADFLERLAAQVQDERLQMDSVTPGWMALAVVAEGEAIDLQGMDLWTRPWRDALPGTIVVAHPGHPAQRHRVWVYEVEGQPSVRFAAGELSPHVWGFFVPCPR